MIELLSPAGSMESLRAAVQNGANAVYLGYGAHNARQGAKNFTADELHEAVRYCHIRGVQVHLTLNTLVSDREFATAAQTIALAADAGVDAFIVQDLGVVALCRRIAPWIAVHASTQMSIHSLDGVLQAAAMGATRAVLARELSLEEIRYICTNSPIEIEVFVHGALCMCYSGQCYMSAIIGRRSGNRGQCAQPCRLPYGGKYPLSLKDNCLVEYLTELKKIGVASLKIEGRMKRPEYVATVTGIYRRALDGDRVSREDLQALKDAFSRQGFTDGYYQGKVGPQMLGIRDTAKENKALFQAARSSFEDGEQPLVPVSFSAKITAQGAVLTVTDEQGHCCQIEGAVPQVAKNKPLTVEDLSARLAKTGGTPYFAAQIDCQIEDGLMLPASAVNAMRRDALEALTQLRSQPVMGQLGNFTPIAPAEAAITKPALSVSVTRLEQLTEKLLATNPAVIYIPLCEIVHNPQYIEKIAVNRPIAAQLPRIVWSSEQAKLVEQLKTAYSLGIRQVLLGNLGQIAPARQAGFEIRGDFGLNVYNSATVGFYKAQNFLSATVSFETTLPQIRDLHKDVPLEMLVYGRLPLMLTENCMCKNTTGKCACQKTKVELVDRTGEHFPVIRDGESCRNVILNGKKLYFFDKEAELQKLGLWAQRLMFTTETPAEVDGVVDAFAQKLPMNPEQSTRGLYIRGVE